ncbi:restriction endonuclease [Leptolyngbya sp. BC1307]|uniref:restriction endonuclease n=1 Tax=Leptolyngbya sp. BC1307 TaxID=2029589 RepID=UPI000EFD44C3|nr:restriction endonuclease [Leptolyngbya sp. BC1307]
MSIPTYDELMLPLLKIAAEDGNEHAVGELRDRVAQKLQLTPEQRAIRLPSGRQATYDNRTGWATTYLRKANLLESTRRGYVRITERGKAVIADDPPALDNAYLLRFEEYQEFSDRAAPNNVEKQVSDTSSNPNESTPDEKIREAHATIEANLRDNLLDKMQQVDPSAFEWLVLQLLHAMGYGGSIQDVEGVPRGPDGGIDGLIKEDQLGLDTIYIQAKCWNSNTVGREKIQAFQGALAGIGARKGVFITTSTFTHNAIRYVERLRDSKIVLIDGQKLAQLMIEHGVGVSVQETFHIKRIDADFFTEAEL